MTDLPQKHTYGAEFSDEVIFLLALENPNIFSVIVDRYEKPFLRKARSILKNEEDAYDAVQETFVRMYSAARQYRRMEDATFKSWAYRILINQCITMYKKRKKEHLYSVQLDNEFLAYIPDKIQESEHDKKLTKDYIMSLLSKLPTILGRILKLHFVEDLSQKEIALLEGVSYEVVRARIHRAKKELRKIAL